MSEKKPTVDVTANVADAMRSGKWSATVPMKRERGRQRLPYRQTTPAHEIARPASSTSRPVEFVSEAAALADVAPKKRDYAAEHRRRKAITPEEKSQRLAEVRHRNEVLARAGRIAWGKNGKLAKLGTISFGLPAGVAADGFNTCPSKGICAAWCYARQGFYVWPHVAEALERNLKIVRRSLAEFERRAIMDLQHLGAKSIRIHDSGDFFSREYLAAWLSIARSLPTVSFYAYTKTFERYRSLWDLRPDNLRMIQSFGGVDDARIDLSQPHARVFVSHEEREAAGYLDGTETDEPAITGEIRIGLVHHGSKPLTSPQARALRVLPVQETTLPTNPPPPSGEIAVATTSEPLGRTSDVTTGPPDSHTAGSDATDSSGGGDSALVCLTCGSGKVLGVGCINCSADVDAPEFTRIATADEMAQLDRDLADDRTRPRGERSVTVTLTAKQAALLDLLLDAGVYGDTEESACKYLVVEGLTNHFPGAFKSLGFKP